MHAVYTVSTQTPVFVRAVSYTHLDVYKRQMLNFAHGDIIMVGSYVAFLAINSMGLPVPVAIVLSVIVCTVLGMVIERVA